jgi:transposase
MSAATAAAIPAIEPAHLPDDPALLKAMRAEVLAALRASRQEGERLRQRLDQLLRRLYGPRSESLNPDQLLLFAEPPQAEAMASSPPMEPGELEKPRRKGHGRQQLPRHLPRDRRVYELSEAERLCTGCGQARVVIGLEVSEQLDYEPASLTVIEHVRLTYACPCCEKQRQAGAPVAPAAPPAPATPNTATASFSMSELTDTAATCLIPVGRAASTFLTAPRPPSPIARGLAGPGLLAHVIVGKFCDHLPLYRCERMLARFGVSLSRSTLCDWLAQSAALLRPLWELLKGRVLQSCVIQTDDTPVRVQAQAEVAADALCDGLFPLVTNDESLTVAEALARYKYQPFVEKRHEQLKSVFGVAPVWLKSPRRVASLLWLYFVVELVQALVEREVRRQMAAHGVRRLNLYPEGRASAAPTTGLVFGALEGHRRHRLFDGQGQLLRTFHDEVPEPVQRVLELLSVDGAAYGLA